MQSLSALAIFETMPPASSTAMLSKQQAAAMGQGAIADAPIVIALNTMSAEEQERTKHKFDIAYYMAMQQISFHKFPGLCEL